MKDGHGCHRRRQKSAGCRSRASRPRPIPWSWAEQHRLIQLLPRHLADAVLYAVNTGCREQEICQLRWDWEVAIPELKTSVFILPETVTKTSTERVVVLNAIARRVIESRRGKHGEFVFTYRGHPIGKLHNSAWKRGWKKPGYRSKLVFERACTICGTLSDGDPPLPACPGNS